MYSIAKFIASRFSATVLKDEETGLNTAVYAKGRTKKENEHNKHNLKLYLGTFD